MKTNVGGWDRNVRWLLGGVALSMALTSRLSLPWRIALLALGANELITAGTRYSPLNEALGVNTTTEGLKSEVGSAAQSAAESVTESLAQ